MRLHSMAVRALGLAALTLILGASPLWAALTIKGPTKPVNANGSTVTLTVKFANDAGPTETLAAAVTSDPDGIISNLKGNGSTVKISKKGKGTGKVSFKVSKNESSLTRNATVTVNEVPFTFNQAGQPCKVAIAPPKASFAYAGGVGSFNVTAPAGCQWSATETLDWITVGTADGTGNGTVTYAVSENYDKNRSGKIMVAGMDPVKHIPTAKKTYTVAQKSTTATAPSAPTGVSASAGNGQATISWTAVSGATSYNIYWSTSSGVTKSSGTKISSATSPYSHTGRTNGTAYYYIVTAVNSSGESVESAQVSGTPTATAGAGTHTASGTYTGGNATAGVITLNWTSSDFTCDGPLVGTETFTVTTLTATTMISAYPDGWTRTWSRPSGTANNVVGTWTASRSTTGNSYTLTVNADGTASVVGNIFSCSDPVYAEVFMLRFNSNPDVYGIPDYRYCVLSNIRDSSNVVPAISYASLTGMDDHTPGTTGYAYDSSKKEWWGGSGCMYPPSGWVRPPEWEPAFPMVYTIFIKYTDDSTLTLSRTVSSWSIAQ